jgi:hypothetical protein
MVFVLAKDAYVGSFSFTFYGWVLLASHILLKVSKDMEITGPHTTNWTGYSTMAGKLYSEVRYLKKLTYAYITFESTAYLQ